MIPAKLIVAVLARSVAYSKRAKKKTRFLEDLTVLEYLGLVEEENMSYIMIVLFAVCMVRSAPPLCAWNVKTLINDTIMTMPWRERNI